MRSPHKYPLNPDHVYEYDRAALDNLFKDSKFRDYKIEPIFKRMPKFFRVTKFCDQWFVLAKNVIVQYLGGG